MQPAEKGDRSGRLLVLFKVKWWHFSLSKGELGTAGRKQAQKCYMAG
jgi:hypothetical protein